ncbi:unnamed protein product [Prunus armeniaca]
MRRRPASRGLQDLPNNSHMERSWAWQSMSVPTLQIFLQNFFRLRGQSWSPLLVSWGSGSRKLEVAVGVWLDLL